MLLLSSLCKELRQSLIHLITRNNQRLGKSNQVKNNKKGKNNQDSWINRYSVAKFRSIFKQKTHTNHWKFR